MPTFGSFREASAQFEKLTREFEERQTKLAHEMGGAAKKLAANAVAADWGGTGFSGWSAVPQTRYDILEPGVIGFKPTRRGAGPWTVAEFGRNQTAGPRQTGPRLTKTGKVSKAKGKRYNGRTRGRDTASDALVAIAREMPKLAEKSVTAAIRKFFD
jgi:hypothetical protein